MMSSEPEINSTPELGDTIALKINTNGDYISYNPQLKTFDKSKERTENTHFIVGNKDGYTTLYNKKNACFIYVNDSAKVVCNDGERIKGDKNWRKTQFSMIIGNENKAAFKNVRHSDRYLKYGEYDSRLGTIKHNKTPSYYNVELFIPEIIFKRSKSDELSDRQVQINKRIDSGNISLDEAVCYLRRYPDIADTVGGYYYAEKGQNHWKRVGRWENLDPLCDGKEYTPARYIEMKNQINQYNKTIDKEVQDLQNIESKSAALNDTLADKSAEHKQLYDMLYVDYPFEDEDINNDTLEASELQPNEENITEDIIDVVPMNAENFENYSEPKKYSLYEGMGLYDKALELNDSIESKKRDIVTNINKIKALDVTKTQLNDEMQNNFLLIHNISQGENENVESEESENVQDTGIIENFADCSKKSNNTDVLRCAYNNMMELKQQQVYEIAVQNKFLDIEIDNHANGNITYERKSEFKKEHMSIFRYINQHILFYVYVIVALITIYSVSFKMNIKSRYMIVFYICVIIAYPFYIYSVEQYIYKIWNFIYSNIVGEPMKH